MHASLKICPNHQIGLGSAKTAFQHALNEIKIS